MEEMDLGEWELLPRSNYNGIDDGDEDGVMVIRNTTSRNPNPNPKHLLHMDYFICPSSKQTHPNPRSGVQLLQFPISCEPLSTTDHTHHDQTKLPDDPDPGLLADPVPSPRVSFKRTKENEFVDMKIDPTRVTSPLPQIDLKPLDSDDKMRIGTEGEDTDLRSKKDGWGEDLIRGNDGEKLNLWKLGLTGIGAICSFGVAVAAATICVLLSGTNTKNDGNNCRNKNQTIRFQIYGDDKRMKEVVQQATKLNEAISVMKGVPVVRAQISLGGYFPQ